MAAILKGVGTALPAERRPTDFFVNHAKQLLRASPRQAQVLEQLYRRTEIASRASVLISSERREDSAVPMFSMRNAGDPGTQERMRIYAREVPDLAIRSCRAALMDAGITGDTVTHLITVSCTGFFAPGIDTKLIEQLPLSRQTERTHIGFMGCHGAMNALRIAKALAESDARNVVLVCAAELCSLHFQREWTADNVVANSLFSDGAAALVLTSTKPNRRSDLTYVASGSFLIPDTTVDMQWEITDHGFKMKLAADLPETVSEWLPGWLDRWLNGIGLCRRQIENWIVHPGGPRILDAVESCLDLPTKALAASRAVLSDCGNMSSPTVLFILERMRPDLSGPTVMLGFGPGLTIEAALLARQ